MDTDRLNRWLTLITNLGVVAGLIFLAVELNQNTKATIAAASETVTNQSLDYFALGMDNQVIARARHKNNVGEELSAFEKDQLRWHQYYNFRVFENVFLQYRRGYFEIREWERYEKIIHSRLTTDPFAQQMWEERAYTWTKEFKEEGNRIREATIDD
jgi:hypothetical protein